MFAEERIFGKNDAKIGPSTRMSIPAYTKREVGEKLVLLACKNNRYKIYSYKTMNEIFDKYYEDLQNAKTEEQEKHARKIIYALRNSIVKVVKVDSYGRIYLGPKFRYERNATLTGAYNHLILELKK